PRSYSFPYTTLFRSSIRRTRLSLPLASASAMDSWVSAATGVSSVMARFRQAVDRLTRHRASGLQAGVAARLLKYHNGKLPGAWQTAPEAWAPPPYCAHSSTGGQAQNRLRSP